MQTLNNLLNNLLNNPIASVIAAGIAAIAAIIGAIIAFVGARQRSTAERRHTAVLNALSYFEGGTQKRNIGISQYVSIWNEKDFESYKGIFLDTFYGQVVYIFSGGKNRFKVHELVNVSRMMELLIKANFLKPRKRLMT